MRLYRSRFLVGLLLWHCGAAALAAELPSPRLDLSELTQEVVARNPEIQAAHQRWVAATAGIPQAQTLPDPRVNLSYQNVTEREGMYGVSQELPFPGKLRLRGAVATREAERLEQEYLATRLRIIARLKETYFDLHLVHKSLAVVEKNKRLLQDFASTATARYGVGRATQQDVFRAQTEISRVLVRLATLEQRKESLRADINRLLNRSPFNPLGAPPEITVTPLRQGLAERITCSLPSTVPTWSPRNRSICWP